MRRENWTFQLHATTGAYEIQSRATDAVGNIETPGTPVTVEVDSTAPTVTVDAPPSTPITPGVDWKPDGTEPPAAWILAILLFHVGLPYFVLASTGPLIQSWFSLSGPDRSPYRLYALVVNRPDRRRFTFGAEWVILTNSKELLDDTLFTAAARPVASGSTRKVALWTDQYHNLFQILKVFHH